MSNTQEVLNETLSGDTGIVGFTWDDAYEVILGTKRATGDHANSSQSSTVYGTANAARKYEGTIELKRF